MPKELPIKDFIDVFAPRIKAKECVLFLGPRFGLTEEGKSVSETVRAHLKDQGFFDTAGNMGNAATDASSILSNLIKSAGIHPAEQMPESQDDILKKFLDTLALALAAAEKAPDSPLARLLKSAGLSPSGGLLDEDFENLFLLKQKDSLKEYTLKRKLSDCYGLMKPGPIYEAVARLPFKAIISCTADPMLEKAFIKVGKKNDYQFRWYSSKGSNSGKEESIAKDKTILYNLFGKSDDPETLIVNYEAFFKFFVSLFNNNNPMPKDLQLVLDEAKFFMLLGFDMSKWYFPFIVSKLNLEKNSFNTSSAENFSVLTQDSVFYPNTELKMSTTFIVLQSQTELALNQIREAVGDSDQTPPPQPADEPWRSNYLSDVDLLLKDGQLKEAIDALLLEKQRLDIREELANNLTTLLVGLATATTARNKGQIDFSELIKVQSKTSDEILSILGILKGSIPSGNN